MAHPGDSETISCDEILFRAILKKKHISDGMAEAEAFLLRPQDHGKLSTYRKRIVTLAECKASFKACAGVVTLHAGHVRASGNEKELEIDVIGDPPPPGHASILNLPDEREDFILAQWIASKLRDQSRPAE
jgi:hypothetical protein